MNPDDIDAQGQLDELRDNVKYVMNTQSSAAVDSSEIRRILETHTHQAHDGTYPVLLSSQDARFSTLGIDPLPITGLGAGFTITPTFAFHTLTASAARTSSTTNAIIDASRTGQLLLLQGTSDTNTVTIKDAANTHLNGDCVLGIKDTLLLVWNDGVWIEVARGAGSGGGGGTPGGADTNVQYNDGSAFGGDANFTWDKTGRILSLGSDTLSAVLKSPDAVASSSTTGVDLDIKTGTGDGNKRGGRLNITAGDGGDDGDGGDLNLTAGNGGASSGDGANISLQAGGGDTPGYVTHRGGDARSGSGSQGGNTQLIGGSGDATYRHGDVEVFENAGGGSKISRFVLRHPTNAAASFRIVSTKTTTNATPATSDALESVSLQANQAAFIEAKVIAHRTSGAAGTANDSASYVRRATYKHTGGAPTLVGAIQDAYTAEDQAGWDCTFTVSGDDVLLQFTGAVDNTIRWVYEIVYIGNNLE